MMISIYKDFLVEDEDIIKSEESVSSGVTKNCECQAQISVSLELRSACKSVHVASNLKIWVFLLVVRPLEGL
jgi:hypothetical protein